MSINFNTSFFGNGVSRHIALTLVWGPGNLASFLLFSYLALAEIETALPEIKTVLRIMETARPEIETALPKIETALAEHWDFVF